MLLGGDDLSDGRPNHGLVIKNSSNSCSNGISKSNSNSQLLLSMQDESLRTLVQRQSNDLKELLEFSSIEKDCFNRQLCDLKLQNEQYLTKINELLQEREFILNSSSDNKIIFDSSSFVAVSVESHRNNSGEENDMKHSLDDDGHNIENNNNNSNSTSRSITNNNNNNYKSANNSNNNDIDMKLREVQAVSGFTCLRDLCLRDLTLMNSDSKRLLAEATRQLGLLDNAYDPMSL